MKKVSFFAFALIFAGAIACNNPQAEEAADDATETVDEAAEAGDDAADATEDAAEAVEEVADSAAAEGDSAAAEGADAMEGEVEEAMHEGGDHDHSEHADEM